MSENTGAAAEDYVRSASHDDWYVLRATHLSGTEKVSGTIIRYMTNEFEERYGGFDLRYHSDEYRALFDFLGADEAPAGFDARRVPYPDDI